MEKSNSHSSSGTEKVNHRTVPTHTDKLRLQLHNITSNKECIGKTSITQGAGSTPSVATNAVTNNTRIITEAMRQQFVEDNPAWKGKQNRKKVNKDAEYGQKEVRRSDRLNKF